MFVQRHCLSLYADVEFFHFQRIAVLEEQLRSNPLPCRFFFIRHFDSFSKKIASVEVGGSKCKKQYEYELRFAQSITFSAFAFPVETERV